MDTVKKILDQSLLLDLETTPDGKVLKVGAVCGGKEGYLKGRFSQSDVNRTLDELGRTAKYVLGHNILDHDLPILRKQFPSLHLHSLPAIDTLFLSPIAFPENPYHHLVKDYRLLSTALNDPVCDAKNFLCQSSLNNGATSSRAPPRGSRSTTWQGHWAYSLAAA